MILRILIVFLLLGQVPAWAESLRIYHIDVEQADAKHLLAFYLKWS